LRILLLGDVGRNEGRALFPQSFCRLIPLRLLAVGDHHPRPFLDEALGDAPADAAGRPDDQRHAGVEPARHACFCLMRKFTLSNS
jgi:hypothetical protein